MLCLEILQLSDEKLIVDHIDGNKLNNNISNLRWITYSDNVKKCTY